MSAVAGRLLFALIFISSAMNKITTFGEDGRGPPTPPRPTGTRQSRHALVIIYRAADWNPL